MIHHFKYIFYLLIFMFSAIPAGGQDFSNRIVLGEDVAKRYLIEALRDSTTIKKWNKNHISTEIKSKETAVAVAEPTLFKIYGKKHIISERPYEIYFIDNYWILMGTIPENSVGGGFLIILRARDGWIIKLTHFQ
jgi:hypothetical protein